MPKKKPVRKTARRAAKRTTALAEVLGRALIDKEFRELLFEDRTKALRGTRLAKADREALDDLDRKEVETQAVRLKGKKSNITIAVAVKKSF